MEKFLKISFGTYGWGLFGYASAILKHLYNHEVSSEVYDVFIDITNPDYGNVEDGQDGWSPYWENISSKSKDEIYFLEKSNKCTIKLSLQGNPVPHPYFGNHICYGGTEIGMYKDLKPIAKKYFNVHNHILKDVQEFVDTNFKGKKTLAIHYRGTDKITEWQRTPEHEVVNVVTKLVEEEGYEQVYVCTDEIEVMKYFENEIPEKSGVPVIKSDSYRISGELPIYFLNRDDYSDNIGSCHQVYDEKLTNYKKGYDVIFDVYTMAECSGLLRSRSNVSDWVVLVSDSIEKSWFFWDWEKWIGTECGSSKSSMNHTHHLY